MTEDNELVYSGIALFQLPFASRKGHEIAILLDTTFLPTLDRDTDYTWSDKLQFVVNIWITGFLRYETGLPLHSR
jgi:hypothetical protein